MKHKIFFPVTYLSRILLHSVHVLYLSEVEFKDNEQIYLAEEIFEPENIQVLSRLHFISIVFTKESRIFGQKQ